MKLKALVLWVCLLCGPLTRAEVPPVPSTTAGHPFRLHISVEPSGLDPHKQKSAASSYLLSNLFRNLYIYDDQKGLVPDLAEKCQRHKQSLTCTLKKDLKWSDGSSMTSADFLAIYHKLLDPSQGFPRPELLFKVKNAQSIYQGQKKISELGITAPTALQIRFEFIDEAPDFEYNLSNFLLAPAKENRQVFSGPYKIKEWIKGQKIVLESNLSYWQKNTARPLVEFLFVEEDSVSLQLYEKNELSFLRRLPTLYIPTYKTHADFHWMPMLRLDYIGFGPELKDQADLRKAFTYSLNYPELQKIFSSEGRPGCAGLPDSWFPNKAPCFDFDLKKVPTVKNSKTYTYAFSTLGGEDLKRSAEWLQNQWLNNAHIKTDLEMKENKIFVAELKKNPPALFHKGLALDRPTCLAALETFAEQSPENYIHWNNPEYKKNLQFLAQTTNTADKKKYCLAGVENLMQNYALIPMGAIHFAILAKPSFTGWKLNQMNQLDLSLLQEKP